VDQAGLKVKAGAGVLNSSRAFSRLDECDTRSLLRQLDHARFSAVAAKALWALSSGQVSAPKKLFAIALTRLLAHDLQACQ
jgi:hypothetical protein